MKLGELMASDKKSVDPRKFPNNEFELFSIPAYDQGKPERILGSEIGSNKQILQPNDVLISRIVPHIRRSWVVPESNGLLQIGSSEWIIFRANDFYPKYLRHYLLSDQFNAQFLSTVAGVGGSLLRARPAAVAKLEIMLPEINEQKRIATILDKVVSINKSIKQAKDEKEIVIYSLFTSLFGDVIQNTFDFPTRDLGKIASVNMGQSPSGESYNETGDGTPFLQGNAEFTALYPVHKKWTTEPNKMSKSGDILFSVRAPVGAVNIANQEYCIGRGLAAIEPNEVVNQEYLQYCLFFMAKILQSKATGSTFKAVTGKTLKSFEIPIPPFPLQQKFASILSKIRDIDFKLSSFQSSELQKSTIQEMLT